VWDGNLAVSDGALRPLTTIRFERRGDYADALVFPRENRQVLEWTSTTGCGIDGVLIRIVVPAPGDSRDGLTADDTITFTSAALAQPVSFPLEGLADLDETVLVDDEHGVVFTGLDRADVDGPCRRGAVDGAWVTVTGDEHQGGYFRAAWLGADGTLFGHVRGRWGFVGNHGIFVGKLIGPDGVTRGHVRGVLEDSTADGGTFRGRWFAVAPGAGETVMGGLHGHWSAGEEGQGALRGVWAAQCNPRHDNRDSDAGGRDAS